MGIGALLEDGIGDTIRVSLTEDAVAEVPVAFKLVEKYNRLCRTPGQDRGLPPSVTSRSEVRLPDPFAYRRRETLACDLVYHRLGNGHLPRVELSLRSRLAALDEAVSEVARLLGQNGDSALRVAGGSNGRPAFTCETVHVRVESDADVHAFVGLKRRLQARGLHVPLAVEVSRTGLASEAIWRAADRVVYPCSASVQAAELSQIAGSAKRFGKPVEWKLVLPESAAGDPFERVERDLQKILAACTTHDWWQTLFSIESAPAALVRPYRYLAGRLDALAANLPVLLRYRGGEQEFEAFLLDASAQLGALLCDGIGDALYLAGPYPAEDLLRLAYNLLQATRTRISKTDYISCPSCGRTLFDLKSTTERIKSKTAHLKGVKIAIMGCIVNGPGEMADADFGYVGAGPGKVNLFVGKECVERNIPEDQADQKLIELIKKHGMWVEPS
ncbi:MAG: hypothetical protein D6743_19770 [Calditrichaeota bacterium]|nr:MAG: hypothetical protein D6743_19770 [Calditrichota bacterium]